MSYISYIAENTGLTQVRASTKKQVAQKPKIFRKYAGKVEVSKKGLASLKNPEIGNAE